MYWPASDYQVSSADLVDGNLMNAKAGHDFPHTYELVDLELLHGKAYLLTGMQGAMFQAVFVNPKVIVHGTPYTYEGDAIRSLELRILELHRDLEIPTFIRNKLPSQKCSSL